MNKKISAVNLKDMKLAGSAIVALTAWDFPFATFAEAAGADVILVGDSLAMTVRGDPDTLAITLDDMIYHTKMVVRAAKIALVVADMPFMSYQVSSEQALVSAGRFIKEAGAAAVKMEGGTGMAGTVKRVSTAGIPVMGHIGLTPQSVHQMGGMKVQGRVLEDARRILGDALALEEAGAFAVVLECVPAELSTKITAALKIPTIGIGAGLGCDGQIQVTADLLGLLSKAPPRHAKKIIDLTTLAIKALTEFTDEVRAGRFPTDKNSFPASDELRDAIARGEI